MPASVASSYRIILRGFSGTGSNGMTQCPLTVGCPVPTTRPCASNCWIRSTSSTIFEKLSSEVPSVKRLPSKTRRDSNKALYRTARGKPPHGGLTHGSLKIALGHSSRSEEHTSELQ